MWQAGATLRCGARASHCGGFSCCGARALGVQASVVVALGLWSAGSVVVAHGISCSTACGIFPDQGLNPCPLHWKAKSQPLDHQGSPGRQMLNHCATREVPVIYFKYSTVYMSIQNSQSIPLPPTLPLVTMFSKSVSLLLFCKFICYHFFF